MSQKTHASRITAFKSGPKANQELRRKRAEVSVNLRRAAREDQLLKRRALSPPTKGDDDDALDMEKLPSPTKIVAGLNSNDAAQLLTSARAARRMLSRELNPPISVMVNAGCVEPLVRALDRDDCADLQFEAAWALTNIASGTRDHTVAVIDGGAIVPLVNLLPIGGALGEQAAWALGNIAGDGARARDAALEAGILPALMPALQLDTQPATFLKTAVWTYSNLCRNKDPLVDFKLVSPALPAIAALLSSPEQDVLADACWALSYLTDGQNYRIEAVQNTPGLLDHLIRLLAHEAPSVRTPALRAVGNMVTGTDEQTDRVLEGGALPYICRLLTGPKPSLVKEAAWTVSNIMAGNQTQIQYVVDAGVVPLLVNVVQDGEPRCQKEAAWAITNMTLGASVPQLAILLAEGFLVPFCALLSAHDTRTITVVLEGIDNLLQAADKFGEVDQLCLRLEECGTVDRLEALQQHENEQVYQKTLHILDKYFSDEGNDAQEPEVDGNEFAFGTDNKDIGKF